MVKPTIGRQVWFRPSSIAVGVIKLRSEQPCAATVVHVWSDTCVNLSVFDHDGNRHFFASVRLLQDDEAAAADANYAEWMPFQVGQAKAQAAEHPVHAAVAAMNPPT